MAVGTTVPAFDPEATIRPGVDIVDTHVVSLVEGTNWCYAELRLPILHEDYREQLGADGLWQGVGGTETTTGSYVERATTFYYSTNMPTNHNFVKVTTVVEAATANGNIKIEFYDVAGAAVADTVTETITAGTTERNTTTVSGGALDGGKLYRIIISLQAGALGWTKAYSIDIDEVTISDGSIP